MGAKSIELNTDGSVFRLAASRQKNDQTTEEYELSCAHFAFFASAATWRMRRRSRLIALFTLNFNVIIYCCMAFIAVVAVIVIFLKARR